MATKKILYGARFGNGQVITRATARTYTFAWRTFEKGKKGKTQATGFSGDERMAKNQLVRYLTRPDLDGEVVPVTVITDENRAEFVVKLPFRVMRYYQGDDKRRGTFETGAGRKHLRFATRGAARLWIETAAETRTGVTWEIQEDTTSRQPTRRKYS